MYFIENDQVLEVEVLDEKSDYYHNDYFTHYTIKIVESGDIRLNVSSSRLEEGKSVAQTKLRNILWDKVSSVELELIELKCKLKLLEEE